jgi:hypothetical protein
MDDGSCRREDRFSIDPTSVADYRVQLREMARGVPTVEAAIEGFSDWQVVVAMERLWAAAGTAGAGHPADDTSPQREPTR